MSSKTLRVKLLFATALALSGVVVTRDRGCNNTRVCACCGNARAAVCIWVCRARGFLAQRRALWRLPDLRRALCRRAQKETGRKVRFTNLTCGSCGQTSKSLLSDLRYDPTTRRAVAAAKIIVISTGANDLEPAFDAYGAGNCGGSDNSDCFRTVAAQWRTNFNAILVQVRKLRAGKRTAIRVITNSNEALADPNFAAFGKDFGRTTGVLITELMHAALCDVSRAHAAVCVYLGPVLNGPELITPQDVNTPEAMAAVAQALLATGLPELK